MAIQIDVLDWNKLKVGTVELPSDVFDIEVDKRVLHRVVNWQLASRRQGTHKTKTRAEVSGGGKKPFKQKGTGNARQGSTRSPLMPGGGIAFGPQPRDYSFNLPKKFKKLAIRTALSYLCKEKRFFVIKDMHSVDGKTKDLVGRLAKLGLSKALLLDADRNDMFLRASRNLKKFKYNTVEGLNVYDLLKYDFAVVTESSIQKIIQRCSKESV
jgi:large subunit ribosomal protein L4